MAGDLYTFVEQQSNRIFHRFIDENGKRQNEVISEFPIDLYVQGDKKPGWKLSLFGDVVNPIEFSDIKDAQDFIKETQGLMEIYGQTNFAHQFISNTYDREIEFSLLDDFSKIRTMIIDIETAFDETGFPNPQLAHQQILSIACRVIGEGKTITFAVPSSSKNKCSCNLYDTEEQMLKAFHVYWCSDYPDVLTGWNIEGFDVPYLINRCKGLFGEKFINQFSPFWRKTKRVLREFEAGLNGMSYKILGINIFDYLELYKKYSFAALENMRLETVAQFELGIGKVDYSHIGNLMDLYNKDFDLFIEYNERDVSIIEDLENKLRFIFLSFTIAYIGKIKPSEIFGQVKFWDVYAYNALKKKGIQIQPSNREPVDEDIVGAYVKNPKPSLYSWIVTVDLTSLYPSIIMTFNMSPETLKRNAEYTIDDIEKFINMEVDTSGAKDGDLSIIANGAAFDNLQKGIFCELTETMFAERKRNKNIALDYARQAEEVDSPEEKHRLKMAEAAYDAKQMALKIALNSLYGASANKYFRYYSRDIAEGITMTGQLIIRFISQRLNVKLNEMFKTKDIDYVVFNDTDSAGLDLSYLVNKMFGEDQSDIQKIVNFIDKFEKTYIDPFMAQEFEKLTDYLNCFQNKISMKREVIADKGLWRGKKHYILQVWDKEGIRYHNEPKLKMMGIETARSTTPNIVRGSLKKAIKIILNRTEEELQQFVQTFRDEFFSANISEIAFPRGVNHLEKWVVDESSQSSIVSGSGGLTTVKVKSGTPIHVRGSLVYNDLIKKCKIQSTHPSIKSGDKIKYVYLKKQNPTGVHVVSFLDNLPPEFGLDNYVDKELQYNKTFLEPLKSFTSIIGWNTEKTITLDDFFS